MIDVSIVIPSYRRPELLARTLASCLAQQDFGGSFEIVVVDNDPAGSARPAVERADAAGPVPVRYVPERRPGISHARNTGVAHAAGRYVAFIDDDEEAVPGWLAAMVSTARRFAADAVIGPVYPLIPDAAGPAEAFGRAFFTRDAGLPTGSPVPNPSGIGNALLDKESCFGGAREPFDPALGLTGGEDSLLLRQLLRAGRRIVWCAEAGATESIPPDRLAPGYLLRRSFRGAQTFVSTSAYPAEAARTAFWMAVGLGQFALYAPAALLLRIINHKRWLPTAAKAAGGLGKLMWHPKLHLRLYGRQRAPAARSAPGRSAADPPAST